MAINSFSCAARCAIMDESMERTLYVNPLKGMMAMSIKGVTYPKGFTAAGIHAGLKKNGAPDLALVVSDRPAVVAGRFTRNIVKGHSLQVCRDHARLGAARAVMINAGCANACMGARGREDALAICEHVGRLLHCPAEQVLPNSTGVIGQPLPMEPILHGLDEAAARLSDQGSEDAARAIMTTDTHPKTATADCQLDGIPVHIGAMAKGSGMIHVNLATMISVITTDANLTPAACDLLLDTLVKRTYNHVTVDGDTSVCDTVLLLANGAAGGPKLDAGDPRLAPLAMALQVVARQLSRMLAADGEGATKLLTIVVEHCPTSLDARLIGQAIAKSPLCKTAAYGKDANWGRLITAAGYSGAHFDPEGVDIYIGDLQVCANGGALAFDEDRAREILSADEVVYRLDFKQGEYSDFMWTCDLTHDYVTINGSYRS
jgi:glutamate N-acetyltransferase/amino-acid N-acetyltransferase